MREQGIIMPDNTLLENAIRPFAVGASRQGAWCQCLTQPFISLIETAKSNDLESPWSFK